MVLQVNQQVLISQWTVYEWVELFGIEEARLPDSRRICPSSISTLMKTRTAQEEETTMAGAPGAEGARGRPLL